MIQSLRKIQPVQSVDHARLESLNNNCPGQRGTSPRVSWTRYQWTYWAPLLQWDSMGINGRRLSRVGSPEHVGFTPTRKRQRPSVLSGTLLKWPEYNTEYALSSWTLMEERNLVWDH